MKRIRGRRFQPHALSRRNATVTTSVLSVTLATALISAAAIALILVSLAPFPEGSAEFAAWLQAVGSIGAIIATAGVAWWLPTQAARERRDGLRRMASYQLHACANAISDLEQTLRGQLRPSIGLSSPQPQRIGWDLSHYFAMLNSFPMHELVDRDVPHSYLRMQNCMVRANKVMESYNAAIPKGVRPPSDYADGMAKIAETAGEIARSFH